MASLCKRQFHLRYGQNFPGKPQNEKTVEQKVDIEEPKYFIFKELCTSKKTANDLLGRRKSRLLYVSLARKSCTYQDSIKIRNKACSLSLVT